MAKAIIVVFIMMILCMSSVSGQSVTYGTDANGYRFTLYNYGTFAIYDYGLVRLVDYFGHGQWWELWNGNYWQYYYPNNDYYSTNSKDYPSAKKSSSTEKFCTPSQTGYDQCMKQKAFWQAQQDKDIESGSGSTIIDSAALSRDCNQFLCQ